MGLAIRNTYKKARDPTISSKLTPSYLSQSFNLDYIPSQIPLPTLKVTIAAALATIAAFFSQASAAPLRTRSTALEKKEAEPKDIFPHLSEIAERDTEPEASEAEAQYIFVRDVSEQLEARDDGGQPGQYCVVM
ncbi:hypothetical protein MMC18_006619 [Xylographa bjoerkii]|nr:hypothetical protein [Xylographa bjoerkii]